MSINLSELKHIRGGDILTEYKRVCRQTEEAHCELKELRKLKRAFERTIRETEQLLANREKPHEPASPPSE
jgi:hypothetical protein